MPPVSLLFAQVDPEQVRACGESGDQSYLCRAVYEISGGSVGAAQVANDLNPLLRMVVILVVAFLLVRVSRVVIRRATRRLAQQQTQGKLQRIRKRTGLSLLDTHPMPTMRRAQRAETIGAVLRSVASIVIWGVALLLILTELGVNAAGLIAGAGIVGIALGFGAQSLVRDFLTGAFMLVEDQYGVGDVIDAECAVGTVEGVSLRTTRLRDVEGTVWHIPNGEIRRVGNMSQQWSRALLDIAVSYDADVRHAQEIVQQVADALARDPEYHTLVLAPPEVWGVEKLDVDRVLIRLVVKTQPLEQWRVGRELRGRILDAFSQAGIPVPVALAESVQPGATRRASPAGEGQGAE